MTVREGSLEAPTRHAIDWRAPGFYDEQQLGDELHRVFDICHGCRRCVSLCTAFPTLFDLIDEGKTGELDGVDRKDYAQVVDRCYLCDLCYMTKCPYVPPHPWNVDFPHLMLRAKAVAFRKGGARFRDRLLSSTDALGKLAAIPVVAQTVNALNRNGPARSLMEKALAVHHERKLPPYSPRKFRASAQGSVPPGKWRSSRPVTSTTTNQGSDTTCFGSSITTRFRTSSSSRRRVAECPSLSSETWTPSHD